MNQKQLFPIINQYVAELINQYVKLPELATYIVSAVLGSDAGITGTLMLAQQAINKTNK